MFAERNVWQFAASERAGGGVVPQQAPPWFASQEQYETFLRMFVMDLGALCVTATSIDVTHLDEENRKQLLGRCALRPTLQFLCSTYAGLDGAALYGRETSYEKTLVGPLKGKLADKVKPVMSGGSRLIPPSAMNQLIREAIEWCVDDDGDASGVVGIADFVQLVLAINDDQQALARSDHFSEWPPSQADLTAYNEAMTTDDDFVLAELRRQLPYEFARMQTNATPVPLVYAADTYDTWFKPWPTGTAYNLIGDTPAKAFENATKVSLREVIRMGLQLWNRTKAGDVEVRIDELEGAVDPGALGLLRSAAALPVKEYRKRLVKERTQGFLAHRRYTFTERPLIEVANGEYIALRPAWALDRFCGSQLYWQAFAQFGFEKNPAGEQFSLAMNDVFESTVGYLFRRATRLARGAITLITESQMQQAWTNGGHIPSVCDWVLLSGNVCVLIDATNHWLDAKAAQGLSNPEEYEADLEETFINRKFQQLMSTRELLIDEGWEGCTFDENTTYVPLVVVPNAGIPASAFADIDIKLRTGQLAPNMLTAGVITYHELQVLEGVCAHRAPHEFVQLLARWRRKCTGPNPVRLQTFLEMDGFDRPVSNYISTAKTLLVKQIGPPVPDI